MNRATWPSRFAFSNGKIYARFIGPPAIARYPQPPPPPPQECDEVCPERARTRGFSYQMVLSYPGHRELELESGWILDQQPPTVLTCHSGKPEIRLNTAKIVLRFYRRSLRGVGTLTSPFGETLAHLPFSLHYYYSRQKIEWMIANGRFDD